jgi:hypothetical protein
MGRDARVASNEGLLRDVNDRIEEVTQRLGPGDEEAEAEEADFLCECGHANCTESVHLTIREYEDVRRDETMFVVFPGHEDRDVEDVVAHYERYVVVQKHPEEASIAEETDPNRH